MISEKEKKNNENQKVKIEMINKCFNNFTNFLNIFLQFLAFFQQFLTIFLPQFDFLMTLFGTPNF